MSILAIVPARGGSKGIERKNVQDLKGHPLLAYSVEAGRRAASVDRVICSTDDDEIAGTAKRYGAEVPFERPSRFAEDDSTDLDVFRHALRWLDEHEGYRPDLVVQLRPTSPLRYEGQIDEGVEKLLDHPSFDSARSVTRPGQNPFKMWTIDDGALSPLLDLPDVDEPYNVPRQALPEVWWQTGTLDIVRPSTILENGSMTGDRILPLEMPSEYAVDIDRPRDLTVCEAIMEDLSCIHP